MSRTGITEKNQAVHRHLRLGWTLLLVFLCLGIILETLHAFKVDLYMNTENKTRRLLWTLAHAHGTLLAIIHLVFAATLRILPRENPKLQSSGSRCLTAASILMPAGFFLGGVSFYGGDPGLGTILLPIGAILLLMAVLRTVISMKDLDRPADSEEKGKQQASP